VPKGEEDEEAAAQETDYVKHVVFQLNPGFTVLETAMRDALQAKVGIIKWWREECKDEDRQEFEGKQVDELQAILAARATDGYELEADPVQAEDGTWSCVAVRSREYSEVRIAAWPPEDFAVASDTVMLPDATYCAARSRPRKQDLVAQGIDKAKVEALSPTASPVNNSTAQARDTVSETDTPAGGTGDLAIVEVIEHYIRVLDGDKLTLWRVLTGNNEAVLLDSEEVDRIPFTDLCPYPESHRFYGRSLADLLVEIQRIKTALTRMLLDSGYFALNQRNIVTDAGSNDYTLADVLDNRPGLPIRAKTAEAVTPVQASGLGFDAFAALEYFSTAAEQRTGVVRNAQGLNPDTLHDTARGAMALMSAAQRRTRMIARRFAEGLKRMFIGVHAELQSSPGTKQAVVRLRNKWVTVDPTQWGSREDMMVEVGLGAGKDQQLAMLGMVKDMMQGLVEAQGGLNGPVVKPENAYALANRMSSVAGLKGAERYWTDPTTQQQPQAPPDPALIAEQGKMQIEQAKLQQKAQTDQTSAALEVQRLQMEADDRAHARWLAEQKLAIDSRNAEQDRATDFALKLADINGRNNTQITVATIKSDAEMMRAHADLLIQASEHDHQHAMAEHNAELAPDPQPKAGE
jgi:hypothetical protein